MNVPSAALASYERLRAEVLLGQACPEGLAAVVYHGMLRGLTLILTDLVPSMASSQPCARVSEELPLDRELLHVIANMVLQAQSEVKHVY